MIRELRTVLVQTVLRTKKAGPVLLQIAIYQLHPLLLGVSVTTMNLFEFGS